MSALLGDNVVPLRSRAPAGDWTPSERARLSELIDRLSAQGAHVDVAYGVSDANDPWCVISDDAGNILFHIARIAGRVVVHDTSDDAVRSEDSLWGAFDHLLGSSWRAGREADNVIPLSQAQSLLALAVAVMFTTDLKARHLPADLTGSGAAEHDDTAPYGVDPSTGTDLALAGHHAAGSVDAAPEGHGPASAAVDSRDSLPARAVRLDPTDQPAARTTSNAGTAAPSSAHLASVGSVPASHAVDAGEKLMAGGSPGKVDVIEGGPGDDRIYLGDHVVAVGGAGHNTFVVAGAKAAAAGAPPESDGVVLDFTNLDHFEFPTGSNATIVSVTPTTDVLAGLHDLAGLQGLATTPGVQMTVDLNGDGRADIVVLVAGPGVAGLTPGPVAHPAAAATSTETHASPLEPELSALSHLPPPGQILLG